MPHTDRTKTGPFICRLNHYRTARSPIWPRPTANSVGSRPRSSRLVFVRVLPLSGRFSGCHLRRCLRPNPFQVTGSEQRGCNPFSSDRHPVGSLLMKGTEILVVAWRIESEAKLLVGTEHRRFEFLVAAHDDAGHV